MPRKPRQKRAERRAASAQAASSENTNNNNNNHVDDELDEQLPQNGGGGGGGDNPISNGRHRSNSAAHGSSVLPSSRKTNSNPSRADPISCALNSNSLRMSDVQLLHGPHWLNEAIMNFYFTYLDKVKYKANSDFLFFTPELVQCMLYMDDKELQSLLVGQNDALRKPFIFFAQNDTHSTHELGGAPFMLLVASRPDKTFFHFDSYGGNNTASSLELVANIKDVLEMRQARFRNMRCLQQSNGYDCGIHVICMADQIADYVNRYESVDGVPPLQLDVVKAKRSELVKLLTSLGGRV